MNDDIETHQDKHYDSFNEQIKILGFENYTSFYSLISFNGGNFFKYLYRYDKKQQALNDLKKAKKYFCCMIKIGFSNFDAIPLNSKKLLVFENLEEKIWSKYNFLCKWGWTKMFGCFNPLKKTIRKNITFILLQIEKAMHKKKFGDIQSKMRLGDFFLGSLYHCAEKDLLAKESIEKYLLEKYTVESWTGLDLDLRKNGEIYSKLCETSKRSWDDFYKKIKELLLKKEKRRT